MSPERRARPAGGNQVTITGTNFTGTTGPPGSTFGANDATTYTVNSDTQITATVPADARPGGRRGGHRPGGRPRPTRPNDQYTLRARRAHGHHVNPGTGPTAGGNQVTITGTNFTGTTGASGVTFGANDATSLHG